MKRFLLSHDADYDLDEILTYLDALPDKPAVLIASAIQKTLNSIADQPYRGGLQSELTRIAGVEVRARVVNSYRIFYHIRGETPEIVGVLHAARDSDAIMARRFQ